MTTQDESTVHVGYGFLKVGDGPEIVSPNLVLNKNVQDIFTNASASMYLMRYVHIIMAQHFRRHGNLRSFKLPLVHQGWSNQSDGSFNSRYVPIKDYNGRNYQPTMDLVNLGTSFNGGEVNGFPAGVIQQSHYPAPYARMVMAFGSQQTNDGSVMPNPVPDPKTQQWFNTAITEVDIPGTQIGNIFTHPRNRNYYFNEIGQAAFSTGTVAVKGVYNPPEEKIGHSAHIVYYTKSGGTGTVQGGFGDNAGTVSNGSTPAQFSKTGGSNFTSGMATDPDGYYICIRGAANPLHNGTFKIVSFIDADTVGIDSKAVGQNFSGSSLTWTLRKGPIGEYFVRKRPYISGGNWSTTITSYNILGMNLHAPDFQSSAIEHHNATTQRTVHDGLSHWWSVQSHWPGQSTDYRGHLRRWLHHSPQPHDPVYLDGDIQKAGTGTATLTNNSAVVTGSGTSFDTEFANGDRIRLGTLDTAYTILTVDSATQITLTTTWTGATTSSLAVWQIMPAGIQNFRDIYLEPEKPQTLSGTVSATHGSLTVTGSSTSFTTDFAHDDVIKLGGFNYRVDAVANNTSMTLQTPFIGTNLSGVAAVKIPRRNLWFVCAGWTGKNTRLVKIDPAPGWNSRFPEFTMIAGKQSSVTDDDGFQSSKPSGLMIDDSGVYSGGAGTHRIWVTLANDQTPPYVPLSENWGGLAYSDDGGSTWKRLHRLPMAHTFWNYDTSAPAMDAGCFVRNGNATVLANGSLFLTEFANNDRVMFDDDSETIYTISSVDSNTQITLTGNYSFANFAGTVSFNQGNTTVTGSGTAFMSDYKPGDYINLSNGGTTRDQYLITDVVSDTSLTITPAFQPGGSFSGQNHYKTRRMYKVLAGTASVTNGNNSVTGSSTAWDTVFAVGDWVRFGKDKRSYEIASVTDTTITLTGNYQGATRSGIPVMKGALLPWEAVVYRDYRHSLHLNNQEGQYSPAGQGTPFDYDTLGNVYWISESYPALQSTYSALPPNSSSDPLPGATTSVADPLLLLRRVCKWDQSKGACTSFSEYGGTDYNSANWSSNGYDSMDSFGQSYRSIKRLSVARIPKQHSTQSDHPLHNSVWVSGDRDGGTGSQTNTHGWSCILAKHLTDLDKVLTGTVTVTNGSAAVVGVGTTFTTDLRVNDLVTFQASSQPWKLYRILSITDNLNLTLTTNFTGATLGGTTITHRMCGAASIRYHAFANVAGTPADRRVRINFDGEQKSTNIWHDRATGAIYGFMNANSNWWQWSLEMASSNVTGGIGSLINNGSVSQFSYWDTRGTSMANVQSDPLGIGWFCTMSPSGAWNNSNSGTFGIYSPTWMDRRWDAETQRWKIGTAARAANDLVFDGSNHAYGMTTGYGTRRVHETAEPFEDGITLQFNQAGGASPQNGEFLSDETSAFVCYIGSGKDNTQEATIDYSYYTSPTVYRVNGSIMKVKNYWTAGDRDDNDIGIDGGWAVASVTGGGTDGGTTGFPRFARGAYELERGGSFSNVSWSESSIQRFDMNSSAGPGVNPNFDDGGSAFVMSTCLRVPDRVTVGGSTEPSNDISLNGNDATSVGYTFTGADIGRSIIIEGASNAANNGQAIITSVAGSTATTNKSFVTESASAGLRWKLRDIPAVGMARWDHQLGDPSQFMLQWNFELFSSADYGQNWTSVKTWTAANTGQAANGPDNRSANTYVSHGLADKDNHFHDANPRGSSVWFDLTDLSEASRRRQYWKLRVTKASGGTNLAHFPWGLRLLNADRTFIAPAYNKLPDADDPLFYGSNPILYPLVVADGSSVSRGGTPNVYDLTNTVTVSGFNLWEDNDTDGSVAVNGQFTSAGATPFTVLDIGKFIRITGASNPTNNGYALITSLVSPTNGQTQTVQTSKTFVVESSLTWAKLNVQPGDTFRIDSTLYMPSHTRMLNDVYFTILDVPSTSTVTFADYVIPRFTGGVAWDINRTSNPSVTNIRRTTNFTTLGYLARDTQFGTMSFSDNLELVKISSGSSNGTTPADDDGDGRTDSFTIPLQDDIQNGDVIEVTNSTHGRRFYRVKSFSNGGSTVIKTDFDELLPSQTYSWTLYRRRSLKWRCARAITTVRTQ